MCQTIFCWMKQLFVFVLVDVQESDRKTAAIRKFNDILIVFIKCVTKYHTIQHINQFKNKKLGIITLFQLQILSKKQTNTNLTKTEICIHIFCMHKF